MKTKCFIIFSLLLSISVAQQQPTLPLQTVMEVEYINSNYALGTGMIGLGDINSDGKPDFAVSAYNIRKTFIYYGGKGVLDSTVDLVIRGGGIMGKGDLNGDGSMDLVVLAPGDSSTSYLNQLAIYFGRKDSTIKIDTIPSLLITAEEATSKFGETFSIGDLNNDGYDDLVVGAPFYGPIQGKVYVYFGRTDFSIFPDATAEGDTVSSFYGYDIKIADINGDKIKDLAIGSYTSKYDWLDDGFLDIYYGKAGWNFTKEGYDQRFNKENTGLLYPSVFGLVDVNADGKSDLGMVQGDSAYFFYGRSDSVRHSPDFILTNPDTNFYYGFLSFPIDIGDINNDGKNDFALLLNPGTNLSNCLAVYLGNSVPQNKPIGDRCKIGNNPFNIIVNVGDVNSDGVNDFGSVSPYDQFSQDGYFIIFKGDSNYVTGIKDEQLTNLDNFNLKQNYPNPFNPSTTISYTIPFTEKVVIKVYDVLGNEVATLADEIKSPGNYYINFDASSAGLSSGIYFYRLTTGNYSTTHKMVFIK